MSDVLVPINILRDIRAIVNYDWKDEKKHFLESDSESQKKHIFRRLRRVDKFLEDNGV